MKQMNFNLDDETESKLATIQKLTNAAHKSAALRFAISMTEEILQGKSKKKSIGSFLGVFANVQENAKKRFKDEDDLWS